jgi:hypothetical protein
MVLITRKMISFQPFKKLIVGFEGMKVDRMFFQQFEDTVKQDADILKAIDAGVISFMLTSPTQV